MVVQPVNGQGIMTDRLIGLTCVISLLLALDGSVRAAPCVEPPTGGSTAPVLSPPISSVVVGTGRLQFYSAPNAQCALKGVFIIPNDEVVTYAETKDGWSSVMYLNPRTGNDVSGWVRSERLKPTGSLGPKQ
jgi:hypothetical protein